GQNFTPHAARFIKAHYHDRWCPVELKSCPSMSIPYVVSLSDLAVIEVAGADAVTFLHGQLSHDIVGLAPGQAHLAGYCTAKGRLLGSMVVWPVSGTEVPTLRVLIKADIAETVAKRLAMFVLRAKVKISVTDMSVLGVSAPADA